MRREKKKKKEENKGIFSSHVLVASKRIARKLRKPLESLGGECVVQGSDEHNQLMLAEPGQASKAVVLLVDKKEPFDPSQIRVRLEWVLACIESERILDPTPFIHRGTLATKEEASNLPTEKGQEKKKKNAKKNTKKRDRDAMGTAKDTEEKRKRKPYLVIQEELQGVQYETVVTCAMTEADMAFQMNGDLELARKVKEGEEGAVSKFYKRRWTKTQDEAVRAWLSATQDKDKQRRLDARNVLRNKFGRTLAQVKSRAQFLASHST